MVGYFNKQRRKHLVKNGMLTKFGVIVSDKNILTKSKPKFSLKID
jgi:hypothetical protein